MLRLITLDGKCRGAKNRNFPEHNVRYIAVNDVVDTDEQESADFTPFRNIIK